MITVHAMQIGGITESLSQVVVAAGSVILLLMLVALGAFAYKSLSGGIEWPDEQADDDEGVSRTGDDDEWKYS